MATPQDAELILKLYELRTEATMREARKFLSRGFNAASFDELLALHRDAGSDAERLLAPGDELLGYGRGLRPPPRAGRRTIRRLERRALLPLRQVLALQR